MALTERLAIVIEANAGKAITEFKKVGAATQSLGNDTTKATAGLGKLGQAGSAAGGMIKAGLVGGIGAAWAGIFKVAADGVGAFATLAASIRDVQRVAGGTAEDASRLVAILDDFEVPVETLNKGFFRLAREIGKNDKAFADVGFSVAKNAKGNVDMSATLLNIADAYKATEDPAKRATLLTAAFGRGGAELIPILEQGRQKIEAVFAEAANVGQIFSQADLDSAENYRLAMDDLHDATAQFSVEAGKALVPVLTQLAGAATTGIARFKDLKDAIAGSGIGKTLLEGIGLQFRAIFGSGPDGSTVADAFKEAGEAATKNKEQADALTKSLYSLESADRAVDAAVRASSAATRDLADKQKTLNDLVKAGAVDKKAVAQATKELAAAERDLTRAQKVEADATTALSDAQKVLDDLRSGATAAKNMVDHADDVGKAQLGVTRATSRLAAAQDKLTELQATGGTTSRELEDAALDVADAQFGLNDANRTLITTQDEVNRLSQVGAENSPEVVAATATVEGARVTLAGATQSVADATANVITKQGELGTALAGDPNYADSVRAARQAVADATQHVADAMFNVAQNKAQFEDAKDVIDESVGAGGPNAVDRVRTNIEELLKKKPELALFFDPVLADLREAAGIQINPFTGLLNAPPGSITEGIFSGIGGMLAGHIPGRAAGGPVNGAAIVGEDGPELFFGHGTIIPNHALGGGGGGGSSRPLVIQFVVDGKVLTEVIHSGLLDKQSRGGSLGLN